MYSWQRPSPWSRFAYWGGAACLVALIALFYWSPETLDRFFDAIKNQTTGGQANAAPAAAVKPATKPAVKKTVKRRHTGQNTAASELTESQFTVPDSEKLPDGRLQDPPQASVKTDSAAVYSLNSSRSSVLRVLKKGEKVESHLEVLDREGRWSLVRTNGLNRTGFVRSEDLQTSASKVEPAGETAQSTSP